MQSDRQHGVEKQHDPAFKASMRGFTLIEVLISVVILSTGIVLVLQSMHHLLAFWDGAADTLRSAMLARERIEEVRIASAQSGNPPAGGTGSFAPPFERYRWNLSVERVQLHLQNQRDGVGEVYRLYCRVQRSNDGRAFDLSTLLYLPGEAGGAGGMP